MDDLVDTTSRHVDVFGQPVLAYVEWFKKFLKQYLSRMHWFHYFCGHEFLLMIINHFNLKGVPLFPMKAYTPLLVNPDAILAAPISYQFFQLVPRWYP
jgi:hypothetical protein